ncbi:hypothetical protein Tco_0929966, partial [Tanacetum coccineum]
CRDHKRCYRLEVQYESDAFMDHHNFPARSMSRWSRKCYMECPTCNEDTPSMRVVDILCNLELIYPPAFFEVMIQLVIHLPQEALEGRPIPNRWMYPFERYIKKLKNYVRNKAKQLSPKGSIVEVMFMKKALTFQICQRYIDKDPVNGVRFVVHNRDECRTTKNNDICSPGENDGEMYYGQLEEILEFSYMSFKVVLFRVKWFDTSNEGRKIKRFVIRNNITQIWAHGESFKDDQYILATQVKQVFYLEDMARRPPDWKVVQDVNHKKFSNRGVIMVEDDYDVIHFDNSPDLTLSTSLVDLEFATLNIDGQSMDVDAPSDIINMSANVAWGHGGKGTQKPNRGGRKAGRLDTRGETGNLELRRITRINEARNRSALNWDKADCLLALILRTYPHTEPSNDRKHAKRHGSMPICQHYIDKDPGVGASGDLFALAYGPTSTPISVNSCIVNGVRFIVHNRDERRTTQNNGICSPSEKDEDIMDSLKKFSNIIDVDEYDDFIDDEDVLPHDLAGSDDEDLINDDDDDVAVMSTYVARVHGGVGGGDDHPPSTLEFHRLPRNLRLRKITDQWDPQKIQFEGVPDIDYWPDAKNAARALQNAQNRAKSKVFCRQGSRSLAVIRDMQFEARIQYEKMLRLRDLGENTPTCVPYTEDQIIAMVRQGKQRGYIPGVDRVLAGQGRGVISINEPRCTHINADVDEVKEENTKLRKELNMLMTVVRSDDRMSQLLTQLQSQHEVGSGNGSGGGRG